MKFVSKVFAAFLCVIMLFSFVSCNKNTETQLSSLSIENEERITLFIGQTVQLETDVPDEFSDQLKWSASNDAATVDSTGFVVGKSVGAVAITVEYQEFSDAVLIYVVESADGVYPEFDDERFEEAEDIFNQHNNSSPSSNQSSDENTPIISFPSNTQNSTTTSSPQNTSSNSPVRPSVRPVDELARDAFYGNSDPADSYEEALQRSAKGQLSGAETVPDQAPTLSSYRPVKNGRYIRNNQPIYVDQNTYMVVNSFGAEVFRVYRGGGYITLEEVAAYVLAFGDVPANYTSSKKTKPSSSIWGKNLRVNHTKFSGDTDKYPYEPELPDITGCGGDLQYYEIDIGTTGTDCDPDYDVTIYNNGKTITRGAARIVYTRYDKNGNQIIDPNEKYVFYTYNHYNDFQEYLNYFGGWGKMFGNITGGGTLSSKYNCRPTPYAPTVLEKLDSFFDLDDVA